MLSHMRFECKMISRNQLINVKAGSISKAVSWEAFNAVLGLRPIGIELPSKRLPLLHFPQSGASEEVPSSSSPPSPIKTFHSDKCVQYENGHCKDTSCTWSCGCIS